MYELGLDENAVVSSSLQGTVKGLLEARNAEFRPQVRYGSIRYVVVEGKKMVFEVGWSDDSPNYECTVEWSKR